MNRQSEMGSGLIYARLIVVIKRSFAYNCASKQIPKSTGIEAVLGLVGDWKVVEEWRQENHVRFISMIKRIACGGEIGRLCPVNRCIQITSKSEERCARFLEVSPVNRCQAMVG